MSPVQDARSKQAQCKCYALDPNQMLRCHWQTKLQFARSANGFSDAKRSVNGLRPFERKGHNRITYETSVHACSTFQANHCISQCYIYTYMYIHIGSMVKTKIRGVGLVESWYIWYANRIFPMVQYLFISLCPPWARRLARDYCCVPFNEYLQLGGLEPKDSPWCPTFRVALWTYFGLCFTCGYTWCIPIMIPLTW